MKVRVIVSFGEYPATPFRVQDVLDVPADVAARWLKAKYVVPVTPSPEHAVVAAPENAALPRFRRNR